MSTVPTMPAAAALPASDPAMMLETLFTTDGLPPGERRLALCEDFLTRTGHATRVLSRRPELFAARVRAVRLGAVEISELTTSDAVVARTPALVRAGDLDAYAVVASLSGRAVLRQAGRETELRPGRLALRSSARPYEVEVAAEHGPARLVTAQVPRSLLPQRREQLDRLLAVPIPSGRGLGSLLAGLLAGFATPPGQGQDDYSPADLVRLGDLVIDLVDALLAHVLDREHRAGTPQQLLLARLDAYVREHLDDPDLSPETIAAAHHISVSHLHRLFADRELTVAATIRAQRLDRARRDLADPRLAHLPVHRIAARWGFRDHATFTRAFRGRYGLPPRSVRPT